MRIVSQYLAACKDANGKPIRAKEVAPIHIENSKQCATVPRNSLKINVGHGQNWFKARQYDLQSGEVYEVEGKQEIEAE